MPSKTLILKSSLDTSAIKIISRGNPGEVVEGEAVKT